MNPFSTLGLSGILALLIILAIVISAFVVVRAWKGKGFSLPSIPTIGLKSTIGMKVKRQDTEHRHCLNYYKDKIAYEIMRKSDICKTARIWNIAGKNGLLQGFDKKHFPILLPDDISYPPERLARMMGCPPLKKLKSLRFSLLEQLAPFAPVIALAIGALLFIIVLG